MPAWRAQLQKHRHTLLAMAAAGACLVVLLAVWLTVVRPQTGKSLSAYVNDNYTVSTALAEGQTAAQSFTFDESPLALGFVFGIDGEQPQGTLELTLRDAGSGEVLAQSTGEMGLILPGQYTVLGLDRTVEEQAGRLFTVELTPHYTGGGVLSVGHSDGEALWQSRFTLDGQEGGGTLALLISYHRIGGFLNRFFLLIGLAACVLVFFAVRAALGGRLALHRAVFALVLTFGLLYSFVLPPYAAPDEKYHINQAFTLACKWGNHFTDEDWQIGHVPLNMSYRRKHDFDPLLQDERTTVFTWQELTDNLFARTTDTVDSHVPLDELQAENSSLFYLPSAAAVFLCYVLHLGFVPALLLGRLANLLLFAALAALAVRCAPFGQRVFAAAALLPMTLHLAASFNRDAVVLGLCFAFTALYLDAAFGREGGPLPWRRLLGLGLCGALLAPAKVVYLPLAALALLLPAARLGARPWAKRAGYLAACLLLVLSMNGAALMEQLGMAAPVETPAPTMPPAWDLGPLHEAGAGHEKSAPTNGDGEVPPDDDYAAGIRENTVENFVLRLYYWGEGRRDPPHDEVDYWVQALADGDVTPAELAQSFIFGPHAADVMEEPSRLTRISQVFLLRDVLQTEEASLYLQLLDARDMRTCFRGMLFHDETLAKFAELGLLPGDDRNAYPLDRAVLRAEVDAARATRATQSVASAADQETWTVGHVLTHPVQAAALCVRSVLENGDHYLRGLVGGTLSYNSLDLAWGWVLALYFLLAFAALPTIAEHNGGLLPAGRDKVFCLLAALCCCALTVAACILWTPLSYTSIYGLQGRYLLPVLPMVLAVLAPRAVLLPDAKRAEGQLLTGLCMVNAGVLCNAMLAVIAR